MLKTCAVADCGRDCICEAMNIVTNILADAGGEVASSLARPDMPPGSVDVIPQDAYEDAETRTDLCGLHEALTARREALSLTPTRRVCLGGGPAGAAVRAMPV